MFAQHCTATCHAVIAAFFTFADGNEADLTVYGNVFVRPLATSSAASSGRRRLQQTGMAQYSDLAASEHNLDRICAWGKLDAQCAAQSMPTCLCLQGCLYCLPDWAGLSCHWQHLP